MPERHPRSIDHLVRDARPEEVPEISRVLARAFRDDPVHRWLLPSEAKRARHSHRLFAGVTSDLMSAGRVLTTANFAGAALWHAPDRRRPGALARFTQACQFLMILGLRASTVARSFRLLENKHPAEPHWYLSVLGTDPPRQGHGVGSALIRPMLARCDADHVPAYLESSRESNIAFYERHCFTVVEEIQLEGGPKVWAMRREPRAPVDDSPGS